MLARSIAIATFAALLIACAAASSSPSSAVIASSTHAYVSPTHAPAEAPTSDAQITFQIVLHASNVDELERIALRVSDPRHADYQRYLDADAIARLVRPSEEAIAAVRAFLRDTPHTFNAAHDMVTVTASARRVEALLGCELRVFRHKSIVAKSAHDQALAPPSRLRSYAVRAATPLRAVPAALARHVAFFAGINSPIHHHRRRMRTTNKATTDGAEAAASLTAADAAAAAAAPSVTSAPSAPRLVGVFPQDAQVNVGLTVVCTNGAANTDTALPPCTSQPPAVASIELVVQQHNLPVSRTEVPAAFLTCLPLASSIFCSARAAATNYVDVSLVARTVFVDGNVSMWSQARAGGFPQPAAVPSFLTQLYRMPPGLRVSAPNNVQAAAEFLEQYYSEADLRKFQRDHGAPDQPMAGVFGPNNEALPGGEATLDVQYLMALSPGAPTYFWSVAGRNEYTNRDGYEPFLTWLAEINDSPSAARPLPLVHSVSYGDTLDQIPSNYTQRVDVEFMKLAARGVSVIFSSGDDGASSVDASTPNSTACATAHAEWPAASPWVTSVGGTQLSTAATPYCNAPDAACTQAGERMCSADRGGVITSGGGFGDAPRPAWQRAHVDRYLQSAELAAEGLSSAYFNAQGRGYPDVAAYASNFPILINGAYTNEFGTSASAPVFAAMVTQWNDILLSQGRPPLGFLNPWLYAMAEQYPEAFTDVTVGVNKCTTAGRNCCTHGFPAARGWDAVSGHGSPRFDIISALLRGTYNATVSSSGSGGASTADIQASAKTATTLSAVAVSASLAAIVFGAWLVKKQRASDAAIERTSSTDASLYSVMQNAD